MACRIINRINGFLWRKLYLYGEETLNTMKRSVFIDPFNGKRGCYHFSSSHQETRLLFRSKKDFIIGVNTLALLLPGSGIKIIAYCLMDNHIHILLSGRLDDCLNYYDRIVHRLAQMLGAKYGFTGVLKKEDLDIVAVMSDAQLKREICYIHRNPYKARIASPDAYPWSSADVYFKTSQPSGELVRNLNIEKRRELFQTKMRVPDTYEYLDGRILNTSFVSYSEASARFTSSVEYFDLLRKYSLEAEIEEQHGIHETVKFSDAELQERIMSICVNEFHVKAISGLDRKDLLRLARIVALRFGAGQAQLSRLLGVEKEMLERIL